MTMKIDHKNASPRDAVEFAQDSHRLFIDEVVREQRTDCVVKLVIGKRKVKSIATKAADFRKRLGFINDRKGGARIHLKSAQPCAAAAGLSPLPDHSQEFTRPRAHI